MKGCGMMLNLYFDESGNTGTNYLDDRQPYFIYGGWLIEQGSEGEISGRIKTIFQNSKTKELKSKKGIKHEKIKELIHMMLDMSAIPVFGIADKKYMIAAKVIETFFDHMYNPNVNGYLTYRTELKKALADSVSQNESLLKEFSKIIRNGTMELGEMRSIKDILSNHFRKEKLFDVQKSIEELSDSNLQQMIDEFEFISKNGTEKRWLTLVEPILFDRILHVDKFAEIFGEKVNLYVDELWGYRNVFEEMEEILDKKSIIKNVELVKQCKSDENIFIQASDLLCGFINGTLITNQVSMESVTVNEVWQDLISVYHAFERYGIKIWDYYAHSDFYYEILQLAGYPGKQKKSNCLEVIMRDFPRAIKEK